jgi:O-antigen/teichoic acid export membrane protein
VNIQKKYFSTGLFLALTGLSMTALVFFIITRFFLDGGIFFTYSHLIYLIILTNFFQSYFQQFTRSIDKMNIYVMSGVLLAVFTAGFAFVLIPKFGLIGFLWSQIFATTFALLYTMIYGKLWNYFSIRHLDKARCREMLQYSLPVVPHGIMAWLINGSNRFFLESFHGFDTIGIFAAALKFPMLIATFFHVFFISWQISAVEEYKSVKYHDFYNKIFSLIFFGLTVGMIAISLSSNILTMIMDDKFSDARHYIPILTVSTLLSCLTMFVGVNFMASKQTKYVFITTGYAAITCIVSNLILVPSLEIMGAAYSQILTFAVMLLLRIYYTRKMARIDHKIWYLFSFVSFLLVVLLFNSEMSAKYPIIFLLILLILYFNKSAINFLTYAIKTTYKTYQK